MMSSCKVNSYKASNN